MRQEEFDNIFYTYHAALCAYATRLVGNIQLAEDLVEDVFIRIIERDARLSPITDWRSFLYISVRNTCFKHLKRSPSLVPLHEEFNRLADDIDTEQLYIETYRQVLMAIGRLPDKCGKVISMAYLENKSTTEIAAALNITESTVYNQKARGLSLLKKMLGGFAFYSFFQVH